MKITAINFFTLEKLIDKALRFLFIVAMDRERITRIINRGTEVRWNELDFEVRMKPKVEIKCRSIESYKGQIAYGI